MRNSKSELSLYAEWSNFLANPGKVELKILLRISPTTRGGVHIFALILYSRLPMVACIRHGLTIV